jgi:hypothetical protein
VWADKPMRHPPNVEHWKARYLSNPGSPLRSHLAQGDWIAICNSLSVREFITNRNGHRSHAQAPAAQLAQTTQEIEFGFKRLGKN